MSKLRVHAFAISLDGFGAGPHQDATNPLGVGGMALHEWVFPTRTFRRIHGGQGGSTGIDGFAARGFTGIGAWIMGRNMFGPIRGPWLNEARRGWWGDRTCGSAPANTCSPVSTCPRSAIGARSTSRPPPRPTSC